MCRCGECVDVGGVWMWGECVDVGGVWMWGECVDVGGVWMWGECVDVGGVHYVVRCSKCVHADSVRLTVTITVHILQFCLYDVIVKNIEKIRQPRSSNTGAMY